MTHLSQHLDICSSCRELSQHFTVQLRWKEPHGSRPRCREAAWHMCTHFKCKASLDCHPVSLGCICSCWVQKLLMRQPSGQMWAVGRCRCLFSTRGHQIPMRPTPRSPISCLTNFLQPGRKGHFSWKANILWAFFSPPPPPPLFFPRLSWSYYNTWNLLNVSNCKQPSGSLLCAANLWVFLSVEGPQTPTEAQGSCTE